MGETERESAQGEVEEGASPADAVEEADAGPSAQPHAPGDDVADILEKIPEYVPPAEAPQGPQYVGFWRRFVAWFVDTLLITVVLLGLLFLLMGALFSSPGNAGAILSAGMMALLSLGLVLPWAYFAGLSSSEWQATLGKRLVNAVVTDVQGGRVSFWRASARYWVKSLLSPILLIGYLLVAFTVRNQGLHDIVAGTVVVRRD